MSPRNFPGLNRKQAPFYTLYAGLILHPNLIIMTLATDTLWFEIAIVCGITSFGSIFFGHFEERTPKLRRMLKLIFLILIVVLLAKYVGRVYSFGFLGLILLAVVYIHGIWLPAKGINGLTGEPKSKYYVLRGWTKFLEKPDDHSHRDVV
jgi:hypothetical protein